MNWNKFKLEIREYLSNQGIPLWDYRFSKIGNLFVSIPEYHQGIDRERLEKEDVLVSIEFDNSRKQWTLKTISGLICQHKNPSIWNSAFWSK